MRGLIILVVAIVVGALGCGLLPFVIMPNAGVAVGLPVIYVPGEKLFEAPVIGEFTNTMLGAVITSILCLIFIVPVASSFKEKPGRWQAAVELLVEAFDDLAQTTLGPKGRQVFPLMITIFIFLLVANVMKIIPTVDTVGLKHCAGIFPVGAEHTAANFVGVKGYPKQDGLLGTTFLKVDEPLDTGNDATFEGYEACHHAEEAGAAGTEDHAEDAEHAEEAATTEEHSEEEATTAEGEEAAAEEHSAPTPGNGLSDDGEYLYMVTPFVRGASTDLTLTLSIAFIAMVTVQYFGFKELGLTGYGYKFLNLPALEKAADGNPISVIDFAVGLLETVLEVMKVVSFAFRLFGAMFGGMILMFVITFLVGALVPVAVVGLEVFIGAIQAFVFSILFLMFSSVAMTGHQHDDEHHDDDHHH